jgi:putative membrane protein
MRSFITLLLSALAFAPASSDWARGEEAGKAADTAFLTRVVPATAASVKIIEYAAKNAVDDKVRDFAGRVGKQHKEFVKAASGHAKRLKIAVVTDPDRDSKEMIGKLSKLKGTDLDVAFLRWLSGTHEDATVFERVVKNGGDVELRAFAKNGIASGHEHLKEARALLARIKK